MKLAEIADRITAHLRRFETDTTINAPDTKYRLRTYYNASAWRMGARIAVAYISFQVADRLSRDAALAYLAWLDKGNVGTHYEFERQTAQAVQG